jgi:hypothetical protein
MSFTTSDKEKKWGAAFGLGGDLDGFSAGIQGLLRVAIERSRAGTAQKLAGSAQANAMTDGMVSLCRFCQPERSDSSADHSS